MSTRRAVAATGGALIVHAALALCVAALANAATATRPRAMPRVTQLIDVELSTPTPPPSPVEPPPAGPEATPERSRPLAVRPRAVVPRPETPPPIAARSPGATTAANDVVDFAETFVAASNASYAGGLTEGGAAATHLVPARSGRMAAGAGSVLRGDLARAPRLAGSARWDCPFPEEADAAGLDRALVTLRVEVDPQGNVARAEVTRDPGAGFGREARRCALRKRWAPGLDRAGQPSAATAVVNVRFER